ncbi:GNAT family N-acetyltransferase [Candidatus Woesearchaeota archaeon]|nr:GNAT family N-acetyltransferase [Candidatus Woesearchaeota archaeon]
MNDLKKGHDFLNKMGRISITKPDKGDFEDIFPLLKQLWENKPLNGKKLKEVFLRGLESVNQEYFIVKLNGGIIGFASLTIKNNLWQEGNLAHIDELIVDQQFRKRGVGTKLLEQIIATAKERECKRIELDSAFHRKEAHAFYKIKGFENRAFLFSKKIV